MFVCFLLCFVSGSEEQVSTLSSHPNSGLLFSQSTLSKAASTGILQL
jgi:hypothetical protein